MSLQQKVMGPTLVFASIHQAGPAAVHLYDSEGCAYRIDVKVGVVCSQILMARVSILETPTASVFWSVAAGVCADVLYRQLECMCAAPRGACS
jgi:hypothetical protein